MDLTHILVLTAFASVFALLAGWRFIQRWRIWILLAASLIAIYWLQSSTPVRNLDFWFPTVSIALTVFVWAISRPQQTYGRTRALVGSSVILGAILFIGLTRYIQPLCCLTPTRPPELWRVVLVLGIGSAAAALPARLFPRNRILPTATILLILAIFVILKTESLATSTSALLRSTAGQEADLASALDLPWLGFSYLAFRLLHVLRDSQLGRLPEYSLEEFVTYAIFFPAYTAGPIDRSQHFVGELRENQTEVGESGILRPDIEGLILGGQRILIGVFKKFVLADSLALFALTPQNAAQVTSAGWMWVLLYAYALRIYFDFSGYTDVAIGLGRLLGIRLPENFDRPYLRQNLTTFWNSWHITLAQWFRAYFFNPVTRALRTHPAKIPVWAVIFAGQFGTMLLIGLWHGITWNFIAWGAWHGAGLFIHNRWSNWVRPHLNGLPEKPRLQYALQVSGWFLTFNYVSLSWVWFALPDMHLAWQVFQRLFFIG